MLKEKSKMMTSKKEKKDYGGIFCFILSYDDTRGILTQRMTSTTIRIFRASRDFFGHDIYSWDLGTRWKHQIYGSREFDTPLTQRLIGKAGKCIGFGVLWE
jgi:hypothetical protein